ncbi:hypothetical protein NE237_012211 [Protea cynaroides]|uniref:Malectin-like domain-containing protein n=1 Tax=Protea cynaroides TaxID=273540 RepID=A0A9Q0JZ09_9MAGN|nr:hypothetical protein NE237_012211 [Protea cynaroides]
MKMRNEALHHIKLASITTQALTQAYIVREFSLAYSTNSRLNLTFVPSTKHNGAYAFVNGIEVISMPDLFTPASMVGFEDQTVDITSDGVALQTMFRLNVGGQYIPAIEDSGLSRTWFEDSPYMYGASVGVRTEGLLNGTIQYSTDTPAYIAPFDVYDTARKMGPDSKINLNFNLTWVFPVDANFTYIVRFHFCEVQMTMINQRVFDIYINNQTAQDGADVIAWAGSQGVPVFRDYAIYVDDQPGDDLLWVALHPSVKAKPEIYDAILNGIEIFKLSDTTGNLAGPNPVPSAMMIKNEMQVSKAFAPSKSDSNGSFIGGAAGGVAAAFVAALCFAVYRRKNKEISIDSRTSGWLPLYSNSQMTTKSTISGKSCTSSHLSSLAASLCRHFSLAEIKQGTKNFDESQVIGVGGFGKLQENPDGVTMQSRGKHSPSQSGAHESDLPILGTTVSIGSGSVDIEDNSSVVFSQLMRPTGR